LPETLLFQLLGLSIATLSTVTHYGLRFTLISNVSLDSNSYRVIHHRAFYFGICLSMTLILAALLSSAATVRESQCLTAMVRLQSMFCMYRPLLSLQVEDSMMDVYDFVYEEVRRNTSSFRRSELTAIHEAVSCLSPAAENLALGYLPKGFGRLGLTPVFCLVNAAIKGDAIPSRSRACLGSEFMAHSKAGWEGQLCSAVSRHLPRNSLYPSVFS
uniref:Tetraspanin 32 n=1 Tax=Corvus moneduloides TaxID=1196302 RepID=A0A8U7MA61_CORMO